MDDITVEISETPVEVSLPVVTVIEVGSNPTSVEIIDSPTAIETGQQGLKGDTGNIGPSGNSGTIDLSTLSPLTGILKGNGSTIAVAVPDSDYQSALGYTPVNKIGDTMTGDLIGKDFVKTRNATPTYDINGRIVSLAKTGGLTYTFTYNGDGSFHTKTDGTRTWTYSYSGGLWTGTVVT
jgi:hypothetical protein